MKFEPRISLTFEKCLSKSRAILREGFVLSKRSLRNSPFVFRQHSRRPCLRAKMGCRFARHFSEVLPR